MMAGEKIYLEPVDSIICIRSIKLKPNLETNLRKNLGFNKNKIPRLGASQNLSFEKIH